MVTLAARAAKAVKAKPGPAKYHRPPVGSKNKPKVTSGRKKRRLIIDDRKHLGIDKRPKRVIKRGRPVGSKNKSTLIKQGWIIDDSSKAKRGRGRGRPVGSKNTKGVPKYLSGKKPVAKKRGRPVGSKNKAKVSPLPHQKAVVKKILKSKSKVMSVPVGMGKTAAKTHKSIKKFIRSRDKAGAAITKDMKKRHKNGTLHNVKYKQARKTKTPVLASKKTSTVKKGLGPASAKVRKLMTKKRVFKPVAKKAY